MRPIPIILSIIPAPTALMAKFAQDDGSIQKIPCVCLAIVQVDADDPESREVRAMDATGDFIEFVDVCSNFCGFEWVSDGSPAKAMTTELSPDQEAAQPKI